jgi:hypothetical protein
MSEDNKSRFEKAGAEEELSLFGEFMLMFKQNKKYWMIPLVVILLGFGLLLLLGGTAAAPFIYTLF